MASRKGKKKKRTADAAPPKTPVPGAGPRIGTSFKDLLKDLPPPSELDKEAPLAASHPKSRPAKPLVLAPKPAEPAPRASDTLRGEDRAAYYDAIRGVRPIGGAVRSTGQPKVTKRASSADIEARARRVDEDARRRLDALVSGSVRFEIARRDEVVLGAREGTGIGVAEALRRPGVAPEATLDLHGWTADEAVRELARFVRRQSSRGVRRCLVVHGKGLHSASGIGVLGDRVQEELTDGPSAAFVRAFATASLALGGEGALVVELSAR